MQIRAYQKFIRQTPRKLRLVADVIREHDLKEALSQLKFSHHRAAKVINKVLLQAKNNAIAANLREDSLKVKSIIIEEGPRFKRWNPVSRGRAHPILKRTSHIQIILVGDTEPKKATKNKKDQKSAKIKET